LLRTGSCQFCRPASYFSSLFSLGLPRLLVLLLLLPMLLSRRWIGLRSGHTDYDVLVDAQARHI
jgi:hypothetical protein